MLTQEGNRNMQGKTSLLFLFVSCFDFELVLSFSELAQRKPLLQPKKRKGQGCQAQKGK